MARIRSIKPEFRTSLTVTSWPRDVRLFFVLLWGYVDDEGRAVDEPRLIKADCFPLDDDVTAADIDAWLNLMTESGTVTRYQVGGRRYLAIPGWPEHQKPQHPKRSSIPLPPAVQPSGPDPDDRSGYPETPHDNVVKINGTTHEGFTPEGEGEQGAGRGNARPAPSGASTPSRPAPEPPRKCPRHTHDRNPPPCGACADARKEHEGWQRTRGTPMPATPTCPRHPDQHAAACPACAAEAIPPPDLRALRGAS